MEIDLLKVISYSNDCIGNRLKMRSVMMDLYPGRVRDMNILLAVNESGISQKICNSTVINRSVYVSFIQQLIDQYGLEEEYAIEGIDAWIDYYTIIGKVHRNFDKEEFRDKQLQFLSNRDNRDVYVEHSYKKIMGDPREFKLKVIDASSVEIVSFLGLRRDTVVIPNEIDGKKVIGIGMDAYRNRSGIREVIISEGIQYIENGSFCNNLYLKKVKLPSTLKRIGDEVSSNGAFANTSLDSIVFPNSMEYLGIATFMNCRCLLDITIPGNIHRLPAYLFYGCSYLKKVVLNEGLLSIGDAAFLNTSLTEISLPNSVSDIGSRAFGNGVRVNKL